MKTLFDGRWMTILLIITLTVGLPLFATNAWSGSTKYCVENDIYTTSFIPGPDPWFGGNVWHERSATGDGISVGDIIADVEFTENLEMNFETMKAHGYGTQTLFNAEVDGMQGSFEGEYDIKCSFSMFNGTPIFYDCEGRFVAHGSGDFEGMKLLQTTIITEFIYPEEYVGNILDPKGTLPDEPCP